MTRILITRKGPLHFPAFVPVTTFGEKYPLDDLIRPYLQRLSPAVMVSAYFLRDARDAPDLSVPLFVDSGGFASVFMNATVTRTRAGLGVIDFQGRRISPLEVLELQERVADVAFTLDLLIPPSLPARDARRHHALTRANALWALNNRRRTDLPLYGVVQGWNAQAAAELAQEYREAGFEGIAIGGLVPACPSQTWWTRLSRASVQGPAHCRCMPSGSGIRITWRAFRSWASTVWTPVHT